MKKPILMILRRFMAGICLVWLLAATGQAQSATLHIPLVINISGQLYRWMAGDAEPTPTGCDLQGNELRLEKYSLTQSPDGQWAAFNVVPVGTGMTAPTATGNLWICNLNTAEAYALTETSPDYPDLVSDGAFAPDSSRIVWTELADEPGTVSASGARIMVHDLATRTTRILTESTPLDEPCGIGQGAPRPIWGNGGIAVISYVPPAEDSCSPEGQSGYFIYDSTSGQLTGSMLFPVSETGYASDFFEWVQIDDQPHLLGWFTDHQNDRSVLHDFNPATGSATVVDGRLEAQSPAGVQAGRYLIPESFFSPTPPLIYLPESSTPLEAMTDIAFSPDGSQMVLILGSGLYFGHGANLKPASWNKQFYPVKDAGDSFELPQNFTGQLELAWASPTYTLVTDQVPATVCPAVEALYYYNGYGRVTPGSGANNVRNAPSRKAPVVTTIPEDSLVMILNSFRPLPFDPSADQLCSEGIRWREVLQNGVTGWTAESQGDTYFLESAE